MTELFAVISNPNATLLEIKRKLESVEDVSALRNNRSLIYLATTHNREDLVLYLLERNCLENLSKEDSAEVSSYLNNLILTKNAKQFLEKERWEQIQKSNDEDVKSYKLITKKLENEVRDLNDIILDFRVKVRTMEDDHAKEVESLNNRIKKLSDDMDDLVRDIKKKKKIIEDLEYDLDEAEDEIENLIANNKDEQYQNIQQRASKEVKEWKDKVNALTLQLSTLKEETAQKERKYVGEVKSLTDEKNEWKQKVAKLNNQLFENHRQTQKLEEEINELKEQLNKRIVEQNIKNEQESTTGNATPPTQASCVTPQQLRLDMSAILQESIKSEEKDYMPSPRRHLARSRTIFFGQQQQQKQQEEQQTQNATKELRDLKDRFEKLANAMEEEKNKKDKLKSQIKSLLQQNEELKKDVSSKSQQLIQVTKRSETTSASSPTSMLSTNKPDYNFLFSIICHQDIPSLDKIITTECMKKSAIEKDPEEAIKLSTWLIIKLNLQVATKEVSEQDVSRTLKKIVNEQLLESIVEFFKVDFVNPYWVEKASVWTVFQESLQSAVQNPMAEYKQLIQVLQHFYQEVEAKALPLININISEEKEGKKADVICKSFLLLLLQRHLLDTALEFITRTQQATIQKFYKNPLPLFSYAKVIRILGMLRKFDFSAIAVKDLTPNFVLTADILKWLIIRLDPNIDLPDSIQTTEERVVFLQFIAQFVYNKTRIKLNLKRIYGADGYAVKELLKLAVLLNKATDISTNELKTSPNGNENYELSSSKFQENVKLIKTMSSELTEIGSVLHELLGEELNLRKERQFAIGQPQNAEKVKLGIEKKNQEAIEAIKDVSDSIENLLKDEETLREKKKRKLGELERSKKRLSRLESFRPGFMDEYEKKEFELQQIYSDYVERYRNLEYLEHELEKYKKAEEEQMEENNRKLQNMRKKLKEEEMKVLRGETRGTADDDELEPYLLEQEQVKNASKVSQRPRAASGKRPQNNARQPRQADDMKVHSNPFYNDGIDEDESSSIGETDDEDDNSYSAYLDEDDEDEDEQDEDDDYN